MRPKSFIAFVGFVLIIAATYCPLLKPFGLFNWDLYDLNKPYGIVVLLIAVIGIVGVVFMQKKVAKLAAWLSLALIVLVYIAAILKVHTSFSFIPFKSLSAYLSKLIKFKWGWYVLFAGAILSLIGALTDRPPRLPGNNQA